MEQPDERRSKWRSHGELVAVAALALLLRLGFLWLLSGTIFTAMIDGDAAVYDRWARAIAQGDWLGHDVFYQAPLYPYLLGVIYRLTGPSVLAARIVQAVMDSGSCLLLGIAGRRMFGQRVGLVTAAIFAVLPTAIFAVGFLQKTVLDTLLLSAVLVVFTGLAEHACPRRWLIAGLMLGLLSLSRENAAVLVIVAVTWLWLAHGGKQRWGWTAALIAGLIITLAPVAIRNHVVGGEFIVTTSQFGPNFYIGNGAKADGFYVPLVAEHSDPQFERSDAIALAEKDVGRKLSSGEVSHYWTMRALREIAADPLRWIGLEARKLALLLNAAEVADTDDPYVCGEFIPPLGIGLALIHAGVLLPLAAAGLIASWRLRRKLAVIYGFIAAYALSVLAFFVMSRYRQPLIVMLLPFTALGLLWVIGMVRRQRFEMRWPAAVVIGIVIVVCNWPTDVVARSMAVQWFNIGHIAQQVGHTETAIDAYGRAAALRPNFAAAHRQLGLVKMQAGKPAEAIVSLERAAELTPDDAQTLINLGVACVQAGRAEQAIKNLQKAAALSPDSAEAQFNLGQALRSGKRLEEADRAFGRAAELNPKLWQAMALRGEVALSRGDRPAAVTYFEAAAKSLSPGSPERRALERRLMDVRGK